MDTWAIIDNVFTKTMQPFYDAVDVTRKRLNLTPFKLRSSVKDAASAYPELDDVVNITENKSASYMKRMIATLIGAKYQGVVESAETNKISEKVAGKIERFSEASFQQADEYLLEQYGMAGLNSWLAKHACHTGLLIVHWIVHSEDGEYKIHCRPCDGRYTPFVLNKWVAPITWRSKEDLLQELEEYEKWATDDKEGLSEYTALYPKEDGSNRLKDTDNEVRDFWDGEHGELWVEKQLVFRQRNPFGKPPFGIAWVGSGWDFQDKDRLVHQSPSLIAINEGLYEQLSQQLSIDATLGKNAMNPGMEYEIENPTGGPSRLRPKAGEDLGVPTGELHKPVPTPDINRAELASRDQVNALIEGGTPSTPKQYTTPPSAIAITTEFELQTQDLNPYKEAIEVIKAKLARMNIEQCLLLEKEGSILVGGEGRQKFFSVADLKDPKRYTITYKLMPQNKRMNIVRQVEALAAWGRFPTEHILRDILEVEDVDGWLTAIDMEKAEAANPALAIKRLAIRAAEKADDAEAGSDEREERELEWQLLVHQYVTLMRQQLNPMPQGETQNVREAGKQTGNSQGLVNLLGPGKGVL